MKLLVTSDWHLSDNPRDAYRHHALKRIRKIARAERVDQIAMLGDITEAKDRHSAALVNDVVDHFARFAQIAPVVINKGNHDYVLEDTPFYQFLSTVANIEWINGPQEIDFDGIGRTLFLPHTRDHKRDWKGLKFEHYAKIFAHNTFEGAKVESGRKMSGIPTSLFPNQRDFVISGDIHVPQRLGPITYVGAPYTVDFGDDYEGRVLIIENGKTRALPVPGPQKVLIETGIDWPLDPPASKGDIVQIRVRLKAEQYAKWPEIRKSASLWATEMGLRVHAIRPKVEPSSTSSRRTAIQKAHAASDLSLLEQYAKQRGIDERTMKVGKELL